MLRHAARLLGPMEQHHGVRISDAAIVAAVNLSHRYIPARQLPDKAVSLLDTACARVAISQSATPAADRRRRRAAIAARENEKAGLIARRGSRRRTSAAHRSDRRRDRRAQENACRAANAEWAYREVAGRARSRSCAISSGESRRSNADDATLPKGCRASCARTRRRSKVASRKADDLCACRRTGGRLGGVRLDRHSGRPHGEGRNRERPRACRKS